jgi:hypothetical protein
MWGCGKGFQGSLDAGGVREFGNGINGIQWCKITHLAAIEIRSPFQGDFTAAQPRAEGQGYDL